MITINSIQELDYLMEHAKVALAKFYVDDNLCGYVSSFQARADNCWVRLYGDSEIINLAKLANHKIHFTVILK